MQPKVLILVLNFNKRDYLLECIRSVMQLSYPSFDLLVVDNHSTDSSVEAVQRHYPHVTVIQTPHNLGAPAGRNFGLKQVPDLTEYGYVLFLDDDAEVAPDSLGFLVAGLESDSVAGIACGKTYTRFPPEIVMSCGIRTNFFLAHCYDMDAGKAHVEVAGDSEQYVDACGAFALLVRRELLQKLAFFDERYSPYGWEDVDFCLRAKKAGYRCKHIPKAIFCHKGTQQGRAPIARYESSKVKNYLLLLSEHASWLEKLSCVFFVPFRAVFLALRFIFKGQWRMVLSMLKGLVLACGVKQK